MLFSPFLSAISINWMDRLSEGNVMVFFFSPQYQNQFKALNKCMWFCVHYLFIFIYLAKYCLLWYIPSMFLQPMLWQEKLWKQERDSIRPCDHWQVGLLCVRLFFPVFCERGGKWVSEWVCVWVTKWMSDWVDEQAHGWDSEQMSSLPVCQTAQLGWLAS